MGTDDLRETYAVVYLLRGEVSEVRVTDDYEEARAWVADLVDNLGGRIDDEQNTIIISPQHQVVLHVVDQVNINGAVQYP